MAHHSSHDMSPELRALIAEREEQFGSMFAENKPSLGPTGQSPQGKIDTQDEGEIRIGVTVAKGKVIIDFGSPVTWMGMDAEQARGLGELLIRRAGEIP